MQYKKSFPTIADILGSDELEGTRKLKTLRQTCSKSFLTFELSVNEVKAAIKHESLETRLKFKALCILKELLKDNKETYWKKFNSKINKRLRLIANWDHKNLNMTQRGASCFDKFMGKNYDRKWTLAFW